jgi:arylsulfatase A-like enzyme
MHPWQDANKPYHNNLTSIRRVAAETSAVDDGVGEILAALKENGFEENTLVVYAADQGWMGGQNGFFGMGDHTKPVAAHDLMMQIPLIFRQPGAVTAGTSDLLVSNYDFLPSVLDQLGLGHRIPKAGASAGPQCSRRS